MIESVSLREMRRLHEIAKYDTSCRTTDYVYVHVTPDNNVAEVLQNAIRFNGMIIVMVKSGSISFAVNMEHFRLDAGTMLITGANSIITIDTDSMQDLEAHALFVSNEFIHDLNFEVIIQNNLPIASNVSPLIKLKDTEMKMLSGYMELLDLNARYNNREGDEMFAKSISRSVLTATLYQLMICAVHRPKPEEEFAESVEPARPRSRRMLYTHEFVRLVRKYFRLEHNVRFYANKLCISPKYLSLVVKESTGRSAAEIIDEHLLLEAKNLLRFSGKNIQQVAYELNFSNQSSFGKYFKHLTGMSPSEFQNS